MAQYSNSQQRLAQWATQHFAGIPYQLNPVAGLSGESWVLSIEGKALALAREQSPQKKQMGVHRHREARVLKRVAAGLGPQVLGQYSPWLLLSWINGSPLSDSRFADLAQQGSLAQLVARLHQRSHSGLVLNLRKQFAEHWQAIDRRRLSPGWLRLHQRFMHQRLPKPLKRAALHMDIHGGNLIENPQGLWLIDWEYAADGDIALELAALFRGNGWQAQQQTQFVLQYCQFAYPDVQLLTRRIHAWFAWVDYMALLWFEVRWQQTADVRFIEGSQSLRQQFGLN